MPPRKPRKRRPKNVHTIVKEEVPSPRKLSGAVKLSATYLQEEVEVQEQISKRPGINDSLKEEEAFTFFTSQLQSSAEIDISDTNLPSPNSTDREDPTRLASSYIQTEYTNITERSKLETIEYDEDLLFIPSSKVDNHVKEVPNDTDDGLYSPEKPVVNNANLNRLVNRLVEENSSGLLDDTQNIKGMKSFILDKHLYSIESSKEFHPIFVDPIPMENSNTAVLENVLDKILKIELIELRFNDHYLYTTEQLVTKRIETLFQQYAARRKERLVEKISSKLNVIRQLLVTSSEDTTQFKKYFENLQDLRCRFHRESRTDRELTKTILMQWKELKELTQNKQPPLKIKINLQDVDKESDQTRWDEQFEVELNEREAEATRFYEAEKRKLRHKRENNDDFQPIRKPHPPDLDEIRSHLMDIYQESVRPPGEPIISLELRQNSTADPQKFHVKYAVTFVLDNDLRVDSKFKSLHLNGSISYNIIYGFKLIRAVPKILKTIIVEQDSLRPSRKLVEVFIPVPDGNELFHESKKQVIEFTAIRNRGVQGALVVRCGWHSSFGNDFPDAVVSTVTSKVGKGDMNRWYADKLLDPMDPEADDLLVQLNDHQDEDYGDFFVLNEELLCFCSEEELMSNDRLNMLFARFNNDLKVKDQKMIPFVEREVELPDEQKIIEDLNWISPIDLERHNGRNYLKETYKSIENYCIILNEDTDSQELLVVSENEITIGSFFESVAQFFSPRRPLKPSVQSSASSGSKFDYTSQGIQEFNLIINVVRANGIPVRKPSETLVRQNSLVSPSQQDSFKNVVTVCPYVNVSFKGKSFRTATASGSSPTWNEQIIIPIHKSMIDSKDFVNVQIFDEYVEDLLDDDRNRFIEIYQRIFGKFLGELRIPYSSLYFLQRMNGTFLLASPKIITGYTKSTITTSETSVMMEPPEIRDSVYLTLCISLEPSIEVPKCSTACLECTETTDLQTFVQNWMDLYKVEFPKRFLNAYATLSTGKRVLLTRMLCPLAPPFEKDVVCELFARRFVSLIPVINSLNSCVLLSGVWLNNDEILTMATCSSKDLGVLLTCFCLSIGLKCWMLCGTSQIYGESTFVLVQLADEFSIIDPTTGIKYSATDVNCPVTKVVYIVSDSNIWANVQKEDRPFMTNYDIRRSICWRPLFTNKKIAIPEDPVHNLNFMYGLSFDCKELQRVIEMKIVKKINYWRGHRKTSWNRALSENLRQILVDMESDVCFNMERDYLEQIGAFSIYKVTGFPINMPYVSLSRIVERVKATGIHLNADNRVEFAMAVYVHVYPMNVLSVWVFLSALVPRLQFM